MKSLSSKILKILFSLTLLFSAFSTSYALEYTVLAPLPGTTICDTGPDCDKAELSTYLPGLFNFAIGVAAVMAFAMITYGGILYMTTDAIGQKSEGRKRIENAITGLVLVLGAYIILYTINPDILNFNLTLEPIEATQKADGGGIEIGNTYTGCQGTCPYMYTNGSTVIKYKDCFSCSLSTSFGLDIKWKSVDGKPAQINTDLGNKLKAVQSTLGISTLFRVTETWPPTSNHKEQGQYDGTSVDVSLSAPDAAKIKLFINTANNKGLRVVYEVGSSIQAQEYIRAGVSASNILVVPYITAEHFSVYKQ
jgi:hypothetical protein